jgi:TfoX/Sxy family transcriptional regulator of competence genes
MKWSKSPDELKVLIEALLAPLECEKRQMFGYPTYFIAGHMFAGLFQDKLFVRLSRDQEPSLRKAFPGIAWLEPMPGRPMRDYHVLPEELYRNAARMESLLKKAVDHAKMLPTKARKPSKKSPKKET